MPNFTEYFCTAAFTTTILYQCMPDWGRELRLHTIPSQETQLGSSPPLLARLLRGPHTATVAQTPGGEGGGDMVVM